jgi:hypothetical protein
MEFKELCGQETADERSLSCLPIGTELMLYAALAAVNSNDVLRE